MFLPSLFPNLEPSPLITNSDGSKFGKSEGKNIWLDAKRTSPYHFYQYWMNVADADVIDFMKRLSMRTPDEIKSYEKGVQEAAHLREAQKALAEELTLLVHGTEGLDSALRITSVFFNNQWNALNLDELSAALSEAPKIEVDASIGLNDALTQAAVVVSKREARDLITQGSISVNGEKEVNLECVLDHSKALHHRYSVIRKGKKTYMVVVFK